MGAGHQPARRAVPKLTVTAATIAAPVREVLAEAAAAHTVNTIAAALEQGGK